MAQDKTPKYLQEIEAILREHYQDDEEELKKVNELINLALEVEPPHGDVGLLIAHALKLASEEMRPLAATYTAFRLGVAYEKYQNANRA